MTLEELLTTNSSICKIYVDVRDYSQHSGHLIQAYHIGPYEEEDRHASAEWNIAPRWVTIKQPINYKDIGRDYWGVFTKNIPKNLLNLQVKSWQLWTGWTTNNGLNKHNWLNVNVAGNDDCIEVKDITPKALTTTDDQLEGQMRLEDYSYV